MKKQTTIVILGIFLAVFLTFGQALQYNFAPSDDLFLVVQNLAIRGINFTNLKTIFTTYDPELYIPLTFVSYQIDYLIGGLDPFIYHLSNIILHAANSVLVVWLLQLVVQRRSIAIFGGLLFALHPIQTETVVWIASRKDLLSTFFLLGTFISYIYAGRGIKYAYSISIALFLCALLSKVNVLILPLVLFLYDLYFADESIKKSAQNKLPYIALAIVFLIIALAGKERVVSALSLFEMFLLACKSTLFYLGKLVLPVGFTTIYPHNGPITLVGFWPYVLGVVILLSIAYKARQRYPWLTFGILGYGTTLAPSFSNAAKAGYIFFAVDRYMYVPFILVIIALACFLVRVGATKNINYAIGGVFVLLILATLSFFQVRTWETAESLYQHAIKVYPASVPARASLARMYREQGKYQEAFEVLREGLQYAKHPTLYLGAGYVYARVGQVADAREQFQTAMELAPNNAEAVFALGSLEDKTGNVARGMELYQQAIALDPSYVIARVRYAAHLLSQAEFAAAQEQLQAALEWNANSVEANDLYAQLLVQLGRNQEAQIYSDRATELLKGGQVFN